MRSRRSVARTAVLGAVLSAGLLPAAVRAQDDDAGSRAEPSRAAPKAGSDWQSVEYNRPGSLDVRQPDIVRQSEPWNIFSIGAGAYRLWRTDDANADPFGPSITFEYRRLNPLGAYVAFEWNSTLNIQDFKTIGRFYDWYFAKGDDRTTRLLLLWPGLILAPLAGSNFSTGPGFAFFTSDLPPRLSFDLGMQATAFLRPSFDSLRFDVGVQSFAGLSYQATTSFGFGVRGSYGVPIFHGLDEGWKARAVHVAATVNLCF